MNNLNEKLKPYVLLSPLLLILVGIFLTGIIMGFIQSLGYFKAAGLTEFTLKYYREILLDEGFLSSLKFSLYTSIVSSVLAIVFGVLLSYSILQIKGRKDIVESLYRVPIAVPHIVSVLLMYNILSQSGILPRILYGAGLITDQASFLLFFTKKTGLELSLLIYGKRSLLLL